MGSTKKDNKLILELDGSKITSGAFLRAVGAFFDFLNDVADNVIGQKDSMKWIVRAESGSMKIVAEPEPDKTKIGNVEPTINAITQDISDIEKSDDRPNHSSDRGLKSIRDLASIITIREDDYGIDRIKIWANNKSHIISHNTVAHVKSILGTSKQADGSVEGRLSVISDRTSFQMYVDDILTKQSVRCFIDRDMEERILSAFNKRVVVWGEVKYRKDGEPVSIRVDDFRVLGKREELPTANDVKGILGESA